MDKAHLVFEVSGLDPLRLLAGDYKGMIRIAMSGEMMDERSFTLSSQNLNQDLAQYYDTMLNKSALMPAGISHETRLAAVIQKISSENIKQTRQIINWTC